MTRSRRPLFLVLAALTLMVAVWSTLLLLGHHQTLDQHVEEVGSQLKCMICQGESVADSPSLLASQMRLSIRSQIQHGRSDQEIIDGFRRSYGDQIVWSPPWNGFSLLAWLVPIVFLLGGIVFVVLVLREWRTTPNTPSRVEQIPSSTTRSEVDDPALAQLRAQLEAELADEDALFRHMGREAGI